jgi:sec-independent protein translocase protein TatC
VPRIFDESGELRMSLFEHLAELRSRLIRCVIAVAILGAASLFLARPIFGLLMRPVLNALPIEGRSLIYTSGIEEINVLMRVGLYCGVFLSTPVILWQIWGFVSPGLLANEKKFAAPFILLGSLAFVGGTLFCYLVLLPTMFQFLLNDETATALDQRLETGQVREQDALRLLRLGELDRAADLAKSARAGLHSDGDGKLDAADDLIPKERAEVVGRLDALGRVIDASVLGFGVSARPVLQQVLDKRLAAGEALAKGDLFTATRALEDGAGLLVGVDAANAADFGALWTLEKDLALGKAQYDARRWTRPMLTMREQLSLVLLLELAFGIIFELPLVMALLAKLGLVKSRWLMKYQRHAFVLCLIAAAIITPTGDAVNLSLMAGPMLLCYELGVLAAWLIERQRNKQLAAEAKSDALAPPTAPTA